MVLAEEYAVAEEFEACSTVHLSHDPFRFGVHALGPAVVMGQGHGRLNGCLVEVQAAGEGVQVR